MLSLTVRSQSCLNHCKNGVKCTNEEHDINRRSDFIVVER